ncbi:Gfo/Idh/MocA family oxidoreductase [Domibacillus sp. 8LH]|uniref:Gfo/Idh/MocA family protein n=1 Tax=Domibacillus sp. 8LH TaxID=3073900 RepID=UPI0031709246
MKKIRFGILSTAGIAQKELIPAFKRATLAEVTAIASRNGRKAREIAQKNDIPKSYGSYEDLLGDPEIDAVYIPLPNHLHKDWVIKAAEKGRHILCEKPAALNSSEIKEMEEACLKHDIFFMEGFMYAVHPQHARVKEIIASGEIGEVTNMRAAFTFLLEQPSGSIKMKKETGGGSLYDVGCYGIHSIRTILGTEPETVQTHAVIDPVSGVDTSQLTHMTFPNGITAYIESGFHSFRRSEYEVIGTKGKITVPRAFRPDWHGGEGLVIIENDSVTRTERFYADQYKTEIDQFAAAVLEKNGDTKAEFKQSYLNLKVIDACLKSIKSNKKEIV